MGQTDNSELRANLIPYFMTRNEFYSNEICRAISMSYIRSLPGLRGFWPGSVQDVPSSGNYSLSDVSGNAEHFINNNNPQMGGAGGFAGIPLVVFNGSDQWYSIADSAHWDILGTEVGIASGGRGLTMGAWVRFDAAASAVEYIMSKRYNAAQVSYSIQRTATGALRFDISPDGTGGAIETINSGANLLGATTWAFICGRFDPSTEVKLWFNGDTYTNVAGISASVFNGSADLFMAGRDDGATPGQALLDGRISMAWVCASSLDDRNVYALYEISRNIYGV